ncbi:piggyBac transposable element-derived protein 3-like [Octopus bimaculoides]|uniref:piggyBac transposable element-derived protein 3-like n=1 Tax=Octopus bimaculoides TaxID=37653 RepID=UPI0022E2B3DE|nr:piggyBac transposable element-derived protein 3-like [Octopus bimaculoides]
MKYFHAADNELDSKDRFTKVHPLLDLLNQSIIQFGSVFDPTNIFIDDSMISYYGGHRIKQFIRGKPIRWGYKGWVAASSLGYSYWIDLYQGKCKKAKSSFCKDTYGLRGEVVLNMTDKFESQYSGKKFFSFDNFFTSFNLQEEIQQRGHSSTGTICSNRSESVL